MLRLLLLFVLIVFTARAFWRVIDGVIEGMRGERSVGPGSSAAKSKGVQMARDPVCGTFVLPDRAVTVVRDGRQLHFCSTRCRDTFLSKPESSEQVRA
jgi:YHS domain-containing protein